MGLTTICVVGFPPEVVPRELKNLLRFAPGFEGSHVGFAGQTASSLFVKFATQDLATAAIGAIHGQPFDLDSAQWTLKAEFARREMEVRHTTLSPAPPRHRDVPRTRPVVHQQAEYSRGPSVAAGARQGSTGGELTTITVLGLTDKGLSLEEVRNWFAQRPGFVALQANERIDGVFVKFTDGDLAEQAMFEANGLEWGVEWARRNLDDDLVTKAISSAPAGLAPHATHGVAPQHHMSSVQQPRPQPGGQELTTIAVLGLRDKGLDREDLRLWFTQRPGFVAMQVNERIDGAFIKYTTAAAAEQVLQESEVMNYGAEWARRNLDDDLNAKYASQGPAVHPAHGGTGHSNFGHVPEAKRQRILGGELCTITILGVKEKGFATEDLQSWFQQQPGFVAMQVNERINGVFAKFHTPSEAERALQEANLHQFGAEWARRNLDL